MRVFAYTFGNYNTVEMIEPNAYVTIIDINRICSIADIIIANAIRYERTCPESLTNTEVRLEQH